MEAITILFIRYLKKITVVPMHNKDLPKGTLVAILKQAGIDKNDLTK
jgi:predicted RNA binding protein YcfA (HicA-like mRNA interferase family)